MLQVGHDGAAVTVPRIPHGVELRELRIFLVLAEELHFGRAAEVLGISQPAVSEGVRALERRLGRRLFERTSRTVHLTPVGVDLRRRLGPLYLTLTDALSQVADGSGPVSGRLRVGFVSTAEGPALQRLVRAFEARHPDASVVLSEVDPWDPYRALRRGEIDVLAGWLAVEDQDLQAGPAFGSLDRVLAVGRRHRLATHASVSLEALGDELVMRPPDSLPPALADAILPPRTPSGRPIPRVVPIRTIAEIFALVAQGRIVHPTVRGLPAAHRGDIALVPIRDLAPLSVGLIWRTGQDSAAILALAATASGLDPDDLATTPAAPRGTR